MDETHRRRIENALEDYQSKVFSQNFKILTVIIDALEEQPTPPGWTDEMAQKKRMRLLAEDYLGGDLNDLAKAPSEILSITSKPEPRSRFGLDGVSHQSVDESKREEWFHSIARRISQLNLDTLPEPRVPTDLQYLAHLVSAVIGPGLPYHREMNQIELFSDSQGPNMQDMSERVIIPLRWTANNSNGQFNALTHVWTSWEIAVAFKIGNGPRSWSGSYALYCQSQSAAKDWAWRYGIHDGEWSSDVFDGVEGFLKWYAHFREQEEKEVKENVRSLAPVIPGGPIVLPDGRQIIPRMP